MHKSHATLWKRLFVLFLTFTCVLTAAYDVTTANSVMINKALNVRAFKVVEMAGAENTDTNYFPTKYQTAEQLSTAAEALCRLVEGEGLVILTNHNNALPLPSGAKISFFAQGAVSPNYGSTGSSAANVASYGSFRSAFESKGFSVNGDLWDYYLQNGNSRTNTVDGLAKTYRMNEPDWLSVEGATSSSYERYSDAAIVVLSRDSGEGFDVSVQGSDGKDGSYLALTPNEEAMLAGLTKLKESGVFKRIILLLNSAVPMQLDFLFDPQLQVDACMWIGNMGMTGALGVADVVAGDVNPSGRLTDTYTTRQLSSPAMTSWALNNKGLFAQEYTNAAAYDLNNSQKYYGAYVEGIYVGYRYYETRYEDVVTGRDTSGKFDYASVAFPFGYGLSYTTFDYSDFAVQNDVAQDCYHVTLTVANTGNMAGREVVQVYLQKPYLEGGVEKAAVELVGFAKTSQLQPGDKETVNILVRGETFRSYDAEEARTYILDPGDYYLTVGHNAHDALNNIMAKKGYTPENTDQRMTASGKGELASVAMHLEERDSTRYAVSPETGARITNLFDFADMNRYENRGENSVTYVSRSDWEGTWPRESVQLKIANDQMLMDLKSHKALSVSAEDVSPNYNMPSGSQLIAMRGLPYDHSAWELLLDQMTYEEQALLISNAAFGTNTLDTIGLKGTKASDGPTAVSASVTVVSFPSEGIWASSFDEALIEQIGEMLAEDARFNGIDTMYAPGINIHRTPFGGRAHEYFSEDPYLTAIATVAEVRGMQSKGVVPTLKHFAFNDEESARNGICIWLNEQAAREIYLLPFEYAMRPSIGGAVGCMSSFNRVGTLWTGASSALQQKLARGEWDYQGYFITDMASSNGALFMTYDDGVFNGTDLFLGSGSKTALKEWKPNLAYRNRVREAVHRVLYTIVNYSAAMNGVSQTSQVVSVMPWWQMTLAIAFGVNALLMAVSLVICLTKRLKKKER